jgi:predicted esterase YcpF (UPF0227 family)
MNILYLHGMASSHESVMASQLQAVLPQHRILVPDLSIDPAVSFQLIDRLLADEHIDLLVGHSLGGFMAQKYIGRRKILINPSLGTTFLRLFMGNNRYKHARYDGCLTYCITPEICAAYKRLEQSQYSLLTAADDQLTIGLFARRDLFTRLSAHRFKDHYSDRRLIPGAHFPTAETVRDYIAPAVVELLAR